MTLAAHRRNRRARDAEGGFTLVELLVVLVILSLVMGLVGPRVLSYLSSSRERAAKLQIKSFTSALDLYFFDMGRYPSGSEGLAALARAPAGESRWAGPYLQQGSVPADPWGKPYEYRTPGRGMPYGITSLGADGQRGGEGENADISND
ncbi:general secretion pathway protein G [Methylopila capsulata]|uniref:Type II secretion system core protein G n=1 Tax=Methylopila capsulata TaxID=61654 RepID=A0A9W6MQH9_9HYPH|nr:type II secretion system major pseudopilin GspG [Methylopila capsulata]MBM7850938.1 general secretion pathway protein G [Methylopila capsulata]GLK53996.1 type II secretion system protein GspG [Methylopila capsulata]